MSVVYDAAVLVAADRSDRVVWADHRARLEVGVAPLTTAPIVAQVSRSGRQAQLRRFLRGCEIVPFVADEAHALGALAGRSGTVDVVDVHAVITAQSHGVPVITADVEDLKAAADALTPRVPIHRL